MEAPHTQAQGTLPTWVDFELRRLAPSTALDLHLSTPTDKVLIPEGNFGQQETEVEEHLTGWKLHALTLWYAPLNSLVFMLPY